MNAVVRLRIVQVGCILMVLACVCGEPIGASCVARPAGASSLDRNGSRDLDGDFWFHPSAKGRQSPCELPPAIKIHSIHALEGRTYFPVVDRDERWRVGAPSQRILWPGNDGETSFCAVAAPPAGMDARTRSRPDKASLSSLNGIWAEWFVCSASVPAAPEIFPTPWLHRVVALEADSRPLFPD